MNTFETKEWLENRPKEIYDMPLAHTEGMDTEKLKEMPLDEAMFEVGKRLYSEELGSNPGLWAAYKELERDGDTNSFAKYYVEYCRDPGSLRTRDPEMYDYMRYRIFCGREYPDIPSSQRFSFTGHGNRMNMVPEDFRTLGSKLT